VTRVAVDAITIRAWCREDLPTIGTVHPERLESPPPVVVAELRRHSLHVPLAEHDGMIQTLAPDGVDHPLDEGVLPLRLRSDQDSPQAQARDSSPKHRICACRQSWDRRRLYMKAAEVCRIGAMRVAGLCRQPQLDPRDRGEGVGVGIPAPTTHPAASRTPASGSQGFGQAPINSQPGLGGVQGAQGDSSSMRKFPPGASQKRGSSEMLTGSPSSGAIAPVQSPPSFRRAGAKLHGSAEGILRRCRRSRSK
jgi:hypothetical protein